MKETLVEAMSRRESPEVLYELAIADIRKYEKTPGSAEAVERMHRTSRSFIPMFRGHGADSAWHEERKTYPWYRRVFIRRTPSEEFRQTWSEEQRDYGKYLAQNGYDD
jgi:hypothetical protein